MNKNEEYYIKYVELILMNRILINISSHWLPIFLKSSWMEETCLWLVRSQTQLVCMALESSAMLTIRLLSLSALSKACLIYCHMHSVIFLPCSSATFFMPILTCGQVSSSSRPASYLSHFMRNTSVDSRSDNFVWVCAMLFEWSDTAAIEATKVRIVKSFIWLMLKQNVFIIDN